MGLYKSGLIRKWAYPRAEKNVSEIGGLIRGWAYTRVDLYASGLIREWAYLPDFTV